MGYQESILVCYNKKDFKKLCTKLNASKKELEDYVDVFAIGRFKKKIDLSWPFEEFEPAGFIPAETYFVWWGGERHPFQSGWGLTREDMKIFNPNNPSWECVFCEYVFPHDASGPLTNIDFNKHGVLQQNEYMQLFEIPHGENIKADYIKQLDDKNTPNN